MNDLLWLNWFQTWKLFSMWIELFLLVVLYFFILLSNSQQMVEDGLVSYIGKLYFKLFSKFFVVIFIYRLTCFYLVRFYSSILNKREYQTSALTVRVGPRIFHCLWILKSLCYWDRFKLPYVLQSCTVWKVSKYENFSGAYFPVFELNTDIYGVNLRIQSEYRKIQTRKNSVFGHFSRSVEIA